MAETSFPVADGSGVTDAAYERLMGPVSGSGRVAFSPTQSQITTPLIYADGSGRQVKAYANQSAIVRGFRWESGTTPPVIALDANTSGNPRLDLIVARLSRSTYQVRLAKITGTPAATPAAPAPIQDTGSTGSWDLPLARVRVTSSGTTGQPVIQAADVTPVDYWLPQPQVISLSGRGPTLSPGQMLYQPDNGKLWWSVGHIATLLGERSTRTAITPASGWLSPPYLYAWRVNGFVYFQCQLTLNAAAKAAGTDLAVCTLPATFRPDTDITGVGWMDPGQVCSWNVIAATGQVVVRNYNSTFPNGGYLVLHPMTWPALN